MHHGDNFLEIKVVQHIKASKVFCVRLILNINIRPEVQHYLLLLNEFSSQLSHEQYSTESSTAIMPRGHQILVESDDFK